MVHNRAFSRDTASEFCVTEVNCNLVKPAKRAGSVVRKSGSNSSTPNTRCLMKVAGSHMEFLMGMQIDLRSVHLYLGSRRTLQKREVPNPFWNAYGLTAQG